MDDFSTDYISRFVFSFQVKLIISSIYFLSCGFIPFYGFIIVLVQLLSCVRLFVTTQIAAHQASLSFTISPSLLKLMSSESVMPSNYLILCHPLLLFPSIFLGIKVFSSESALWIRWPKYWSFSFSISPFNEYSGLISFRAHWFDLLAVQGTLKSLLQQSQSKPLILWCSAFCTVRLSHPYMTTEETIASTIQTFVGKVIFCFLICHLGLSQLSFQGPSVF